MIGCIRCHRATDSRGRCYICDDDEMKKENRMLLWEKAVKEMKESIMCLRLELPAEIVNDMETKFNRVVFFHNHLMGDSI